MSTEHETRRGAARRPAASLLAPYRDKALVVIPARYGSTRFEGKPLAKIGGVPMIVRVMNRAAKIKNADAVIVATDDERIKSVVERAGGVAVITKRTHSTGTSRVREAAAYFLHGIVVNVQGDEPLLPVRAVERLIALMQSDPSLMMSTLASPATDFDDLFRVDVVKVVCDRDGDALYFSRSPLPYPGFGGEWAGGGSRGASGGEIAGIKYLRHIGVYAFRREFLFEYNDLRRGPLERIERLEQLRALENGYRIGVISCRSASIGVDRPGDVKRIEKLLRGRPERARKKVEKRPRSR
ncbi:MAG: 3-deoxy-manno-octulosonate cytidylyltransferase [Candidatus Krumholzibacteria bacterium]|nr:3-deoxy-manno-octulosonate cytidylyltransferase [Candidatus Krumholzibacteria bacterium]